jgi:hypothetical protein
MYLSFVRSNHGRVNGRGICQECDRNMTGMWQVWEKRVKRAGISTGDLKERGYLLARSSEHLHIARCSEALLFAASECDRINVCRPAYGSPLVATVVNCPPHRAGHAHRQRWGTCGLPAIWMPAFLDDSLQGHVPCLLSYDCFVHDSFKSSYF